MKRIILFLLLLSSSIFACAQTAKEIALSSINEQAAKAHIGFLSHNDLMGREAGYPGSRIAREYIVSRLIEMQIKPLDTSFYQHFSAYAKERQTKSRYQVHPDSIAKIRENKVYRKLDLCNVLGKIEGINKNEYVIVGAHYDHLGFDPELAGDNIYNGADDNASGVSAVLQIAKAFVQAGIKPNRTILFAFWDGEEKGVLGSSYYVNSCNYLSQIKAYLNFDMIGRNSDENNPEGVVYFYTQAQEIFETWLKEDIETYKLQLKPEYRAWDKPVGGSDNSPFAKKDIPIIWYHTNGHPDYHLPSDHSDKINWKKVVEITKASFLNMWHLSEEFQ